jgi:2-polyprenyl-3-methyl-5-hydroxy-6-metoxy-1,4-benzoquinol methylase
MTERLGLVELRYNRGTKGEFMDEDILARVKRFGHSIIKRVMRPGQGTRPPVSPRNSDFIPYIQHCLRPDILTVLDIGCGKLWDGNPPSEDYLLTVFSSPKFHVTGIDIFPECIEWRRQNGPAGDYILMDALDARKKMGRQFDLVICHHVIEHFDKETSRQFVQDIESLATKQIIIGAPVGFTNTDYAVGLHGNEYERHRCGWTPDEFIALGYSVIYVYAGAFLVEKRINP